MSDQRPPPGLFTRGFASRRAEFVMTVGVIVAIVGGLHDRDPGTLFAGLGLIAAGGLLDLFARQVNVRLLRVLGVAFLIAVALMISHPALMWQWMGDLARHASNYLGGR